MQMVGADWIKSDKREDDLAGRPGGLVQVPHAKANNFVSAAIMKIFTNSFYVEMCSTRGHPILLHCKHSGGLFFLGVYMG
jgi:hypothetical protein